MLDEDDFREDNLSSVVKDGDVSFYEKRGRVSDEDVDPQYKLFMGNLRNDGNSYALEVVEELGVSERIRYHQKEDSADRRFVRERVLDEDVDPQYKLFMESLRVDVNSYALEVVGEDGASEIVRYHQKEEGFERRIKRGRVPDEDVDPQYKLFMESLREDGNSYALEVANESGVTELIRYHQDNQSERRSDYNSETESWDDSFVKRGFSSDDENEQSCDVDSLIRSVGDGDNRNEQYGDDNVVHVKAIDDDIMDPKSKLVSENLREDETIYTHETFQEIEILDPIRSHQDNGVPDEASLLGIEPTTSSLVKHETEIENRYPEILKVPPERERLVGKHNAVLAGLGPVSDMENRAWLEVPYNPEPLHNPEILSVPSPKEKPMMENTSNMQLFKIKREGKSSVVKENAASAGLDFVSDPENKVSSKRPCLEVPNIPEELSSDDSEATRSCPMNENPVTVNTNIVKPFQKCREEKSSVVKKKTKVDIPYPVASRTRGNSSERTQSEAHTSFSSSLLKDRMETERTLKRVKKVKVDIKKPGRPSKSAHVLNNGETKGLETLRNKRSKSLPSSENLQGKKGYCGRPKKNVKKGAENPCSARKTEYHCSARKMDYPCSARKTKYPYSARKTEYHDTKPCSKTHSGYMGSAKSNLNDDGDDKTESNQTDESFQAFLSRCEMGDEVVTYTPKNSRQDSRVAYDDTEIKDNETVESRSDSDLVVLERDPVEGCRSPNKDSDDELESDINFREGLLMELKRPYDEQEYFRLLQDWSHQVPAKGHAKNLRNGAVKMYGLEGEYAKCYSNIYPDLAAMIKASDRPRSSNLMRGFFYWLKNVSQDESFEPWTDAECLNVVPQM